MTQERKEFVAGWLFILAGVWLLCLMLMGCARFSTTQTDYSYDETGKPQRHVTTKATAYTWFASRSQLANWKASQTDKTQGASVGSLAQESSATNVVEALKAIEGILGKIRP